MTALEPGTSSRVRAAGSPTMYGREVPAYNTLVEVSPEVNEAYAAEHGADAERLGSIARVTAERHGAIRVGSPKEMAQVARVFAALRHVPGRFLRPARCVLQLRARGLDGLPPDRRRRTGQESLPCLHLDARGRGSALL